MFKADQPPIEGAYYQYLGVYITKWKQEMGDPTIGFSRIDYTFDDAEGELELIQLLDNTHKEAVQIKKEIIQIFKKLVGEIE